MEVDNFIKDWCPKSLGKISFIGHSLGGVVIRSALIHLEHIKDKMYTFFSLSSPHLGYMYNSSKIIEAGIFILCVTLIYRYLGHLKNEKKYMFIIISDD